ncbi:MAG: hypothetical protein P1U63_09740 [Coxiellaceae bacterium]|nr:hypothetical protein [Coxiellaceae bacterium]
MIKQWTRLIVIASLSIIIAGCGIHFRSPDELPAGLRSMYLQTSDPYSNLSNLLNRMFAALDIKMAKSPDKADYIFEVIGTTFDHDNPAITTSNQAITLTYRLLLIFQIKQGGKVVFGPRSLTATREVILNANQLFMNNVSPLVKQQLDRRMTDLVFDQLISEQAIKSMGGPRRHER